MKNPQDLTPVEYKAERDSLLLRWEASKTAMEAAKEAEMQLRKECVAFLSDPDKESGTENVDLGNGYKVKLVKKINYNVDQDTVNEALDKLENLSAEGKFVADRIIKWTAGLSLTEYKQLSEEHRKIIDKCITTSEGAPTLEIIAPKSKGKL